jgi:WD40 repeat protein
MNSQDIFQPYVGPRSFERTDLDRKVFFGRDLEEREIVSLILSQPLVVVYAQSGAGKTSIFNASISPTLEEEFGAKVLPLTRVQVKEEIESIPNPYMYNALLKLEPSETTDSSKYLTLSLSDYLKYLPEITDEQNKGPVVIIFDQFEEIFEIHSEAWQEQQRDFFKQVNSALQKFDQLRVVLIIREDYIAQLDPFTKFFTNRLRTRFRLKQLGESGALEAIERPLDGTKWSFEEDAPKALFNKLAVTKRLDQKGKTKIVPGEHIEQTHLQLVAADLWNTLKNKDTVFTLEHIKDIDVDQVLEKFYEETIKEVSEKNQINEEDLRLWFDEKLITPNNTRGTIFQGNEKTEGLSNEAVKLLADKLLIRSETRAAAKWFELTHDLMVQPIKKANELWREKRSQDIEDRKVKKAFKRLTIALCVILGIIWGVSYFFLVKTESNKLKAELVKAKQATKLAEEKAAEKIKNAEDNATTIVTSAKIKADKKIQDSTDKYNKKIGSAELKVIEANNQFKMATLEIAKAKEKTKELHKKNRNFEYQLLVAEASIVKDELPIRSILLATESIKLAKKNSLESTHGEQILRDSLQEVSGTSLSMEKGKIDFFNIISGTQLLFAKGEESGYGFYNLNEKTSKFSMLKNSRAKFLDANNRWLLTFSLKDKSSNIAYIDRWDLSKNLSTQKPVRVGKIDDSKYDNLAISPDMKSIFLITTNGALHIKDLTPEDFAKEPIEQAKVDSVYEIVEISPNSQWALFLTSKKIDDPQSPPAYKVWLENLHSKDSLHEKYLLSSTNNPPHISISSDSNWVSVIDQDNFRIWDLRRENPVENPILIPFNQKVKEDEQEFTVQISESKIVLTTINFDDFFGFDSVTFMVKFLNNDQKLDPSKGFSHTLKELSDFQLSPDLRWLITKNTYDTLILWDLETKEPFSNPFTLAGNQKQISQYLFSFDSKWLITGSADKRVQRWDLTQPNPLLKPVILRGHETEFRKLTLSADNRWLAGLERTGRIRLWDLGLSYPSTSNTVLRSEAKYFSTFATSLDKKWLAAGNRNGAVNLWDLSAKEPFQSSISLRKHKNRITKITFSHDRRWLATGDNSGIVNLWDLNKLDPSFPSPIKLEGHERYIRSLAFSPDNRWLATGSSDKTIRLWDLSLKNPGNGSKVFRGQVGMIKMIAFSPDNRWLASTASYKSGGRGDNVVRLWNMTATDPTQKTIYLEEHTRRVNTLAFSPTGKWLATGSKDKSIRLWNIDQEDPSKNSISLDKQKGRIQTLVFSPDGKFLATGSKDRTTESLLVWPINKNGPDGDPKSLKGHESRINALAFSSDGARLASLNGDRTVRVWDLTNDNPSKNSIVIKGELTGRGGFLAFGPNDTRLVAGSFGKNLNIWSLKMEELYEQARNLAGRNLCKSEWNKYFPEREYQKTFKDLPSCD